MAAMATPFRPLVAVPTRCYRLAYCQPFSATTAPYVLLTPQDQARRRVLRFAQQHKQQTLKREAPNAPLWTRLKRRLGWERIPNLAYIPPPFTAKTNPYRAHKKWPPDFRTLSNQYQFKYEKTFKRRMALKWARPTFMKVTKLIQNGLITIVIIGAVFFYEDENGTPFDPFREWFFGKLKTLGSLPSATRDEVERLEAESRPQQAQRLLEDDNSPVAMSEDESLDNKPEKKPRGWNFAARYFNAMIGRNTG